MVWISGTVGENERQVDRVELAGAKGHS